MATKSFTQSLRTLRASLHCSRDPVMQCLAPRFTRSLATEAFTSDITRNADPTPFTNSSIDTSTVAPPTSVLTTIYSFPTLEPLRFESYPAKHLHLPLRRDILHRAVIYEGDLTRQGTASSKTRFEVHGSHRKIRPQKGSGRARLGTKQSPMLKGGGKSFGPHPRDFATDLPRKMYDLAFRTALSYRYRRGELIVCEGEGEAGAGAGMEIEYPKTRFVKRFLEHHHWGNVDGRSLIVTSAFRPNLFRALRHAPEDGRVLMQREVDVKDLLELGRIVIEKRALDEILLQHQSDLVSKRPSAA